MDERPYFAHSANPGGTWHRLRDHLGSVATIARTLAGSARWAAEADLAGLLHDIGKYGDPFKGRLRREQAGIDHWSLGAWIPLREQPAQVGSLDAEWGCIRLQQAEKHSFRRLLLAKNVQELTAAPDSVRARLGHATPSWPGGWVFASPLHSWCCTLLVHCRFIHARPTAAQHVQQVP